AKQPGITLFLMGTHRQQKYQERAPAMFGCGAVAQMVLSKGSHGTFLTVNVAFGFAATLGILVSGQISGGDTVHLILRCAITFIICKNPVCGKKVPLQYLPICWVDFAMNIIIIYSYKQQQKMALIDNPPCTASQIIGTAALIMCTLAILDPHNNPVPRGLEPFTMGFVVLVIGLSMDFTSGYAINPARDLGPRIFMAHAGWCTEIFTANTYFVPICAPFFGALSGVLMYQLIIGYHVEEVQEKKKGRGGAHMDMAHGEIQEERTKEPADEITEKVFLKDLHLFMKKRDTPIERIPNLGFKQIDLFLMFKTVRDLGGYHQVTSQQLWKQVYNMLGGNPRSTSAATCTRRHYEKLLLPYECHVKGISMNVLPQNQPKQHPYRKDDDDDGQRPAKRKLLTMPVRQSPHNLQAAPLGHVFPLVHYPHYYPSSLAVLPSHIPISSTVLTPHRPPQPQFSFHPYGLTETDKVKEPLEQLRYLAEQYKTSTGLID
ncbi:hypothetical protein L3Q82_012451, partial [Scortum barcoo]